MLLREQATFPLAMRLREAPGVPIGEVYSFLSGLYFRGKLAYARAWARPAGAVRVIVPGRGLVTPDLPVTHADMLEIAGVPVDVEDARYREPLTSDADELARTHPQAAAILLGSIATGKYVDILAHSFGPRLRVPLEFVGRGDMSRGGLMLRYVDEGRELTYAAVESVPRRGPRPPKLVPRPRPRANA